MGIYTNAQPYILYGYVKTKGTKDAFGERIENVRIKLKGNENVYRSNSRGEFDIYSTNKNFSIERVDHPDFELLDYDILEMNYEISSEQFPIVVINKEKLEIERSNIFCELLSKFKETLNSLGEIKINYKELETKCMKMADRLARIDYDSMEAIDRKIHECMENGDFDKADSLILSKGSIDERIKYNKKGDNSIIGDCYLLYINAASRGDINSALKYLEKRVDTAPDNIECLTDAADAYTIYQTNADKSFEYYDQAYYFARKKYGPTHHKTIECLLNISTSHFICGDLKQATRIIRECLSVYNVPNISDNEESYSDIERKDVLTKADSALICQSYSRAINILALEGKFQHAINLTETAIKYCVDDNSRSELWISTIMLFIAANMIQDAINLIDPIIDEYKNSPIDAYSAPIYSISALCHAQMNNYDKALKHADSVILYYKNIDQMNDYVCNAMLAKSIALLQTSNLDALSELFNEFDKEFSRLGVNSLSKVIYCQYLNNKGVYQYLKKEYEDAEETLLKSYEYFKTLTDLKPARIEAFIFSNLALIYQETNRLEYALIAAQHCFNTLYYLYESVGLRNSDMWLATCSLALIELELKHYYSAFNAYRFLYTHFKETIIVDEIDKCYMKAVEDKDYNKKEFKKLNQEYNEFKNQLP